jgi:hypothetical protein
LHANQTVAVPLALATGVNVSAPVAWLMVGWLLNKALLLLVISNKLRLCALS